MASSEVGKLLLDENLEVRRFSAEIRDIFRILESDIGRPLNYLTHRLVDINPVACVNEVGRNRQIMEREVQTEDGRWYQMRILPYQIGPEVYSGTMLRFVEITELKKNRDELAEKNRKCEEAQELARLGYWELEIDSGALPGPTGSTKSSKSIPRLSRPAMILFWLWCIRKTGKC